LAKCRMREEMKPFYRLELFPDLRALRMFQDGNLYPLGPFVVDGFAALKKLERLVILIDSRSIGTSYILKGFLKLPLIKEFSLSIPFITHEEWGLLHEFLRNQEKLELVSIIVKAAP